MRWRAMHGSRRRPRWKAPRPIWADRRAESVADGPTAMQRAVWQAKHNAARGTLARVIVPGWRQSDGSLWQLNQSVAVRIPFLSLGMELLIAGVSYQLTPHRRRHTELTVGPVDGYSRPKAGEAAAAPQEPAQRRRRAELGWREKGRFRCELYGPGLAETKHAEEDRPVRVQPIGRRRTDLAGNDGAIERRQLVEAHERRNVQAGPGGRGDGSHVGTAALN